MSGSLNAGDRITAVKDDAGIQEIDATMVVEDVYRLLQGESNTFIDLDVEDGKNEKTVRVKREVTETIPIHAIAFAADSKEIIVATQRGGVRQSLSGEVKQHYKTSGASVSVSPDGKLLALDDYSEVMVWDLEENRLMERLPVRLSKSPSGRHHLGGTTAFSPDGKYLALATGYRLWMSGRSEVKVWDLTTFTEIQTSLHSSDMRINGVVFSPDGKSLVTSDGKGVLKIWDTTTWQLKETLVGLGDHANCVVVSSEGRWLAHGSFQGIVIWHLPSLEKRHILRDESVAAACFSNDGRTLIASRTDGKIVMWDVETGLALASIDVGSDTLVGCKLSPDGQKLAVCSSQSNIWIWDVPSLEYIDEHPLTISALADLGTGPAVVSGKQPDKPPPKSNEILQE